MPALYVVLVLVAGWMAAAVWGPLRGIDPYPFAFLLFLNNVVQLVLCSVILVGQRVLGAAADRRAVQTFENAEAIFAHVADLQGHLDRHDRALGRGVSLLRTSLHPWIRHHRVQVPPQAIDHAIGVNGRIAAWLTQRLGSMWSFYAALLIQTAWIGLAELGLQRVDPYPFAFMTFLSTLVQLIFMIVIMVGQDVLGRAADRRSEQTYLDADAILHECRRMKARLVAQDRVIDSLTNYTSAQVAERLAQAIHEADARTAEVSVPGSDAAGAAAPPTRWDELAEELKESARAQAQQLGETLAAIGCVMVPKFDATLSFVFDDHEVHLLARVQHQHSQAHRDVAHWDDLSDHVRSRKMETIRDIPVILDGVGFQVVRDGEALDGRGEADFTADEWATLQQGLMASGVLVGLSVGVLDPEEMFALIKKLREASVGHPRRLIRELAATSTFDTGTNARTRYADYEGPALAAIRSATTIVAERAPSDLADFRAFLIDIAEVVADANNEGGFFGLGARPRAPGEAAAIEAVGRAVQPDVPRQRLPVAEAVPDGARPADTRER
jgi:uncharacterized membrane protein